MRKKLLLGLLVIGIVLASTACTNNSAPSKPQDPGASAKDSGVTVTMDPAGYSKCSEKINVKALLSFTFPTGVVLWDSPNEIPFYKEYEEKTNIHVDWELVAAADYKQRMNIMISGGDMPDMFMKTNGVSDADLIQNGASGAIIDLTPYLEKYAPDLNKYIVDHDLVSYLKMNNGIWGFPYLLETDGLKISKIFFNTDYLTKVNMPMPKTVDEITKTFEAFKAVMGNDEIPMGVRNQEDFFGWFSGAFGLQNRGKANSWIDADPTDASGKTLRFWRGDDAVKDLLKLEKLYYDKGIIQKNFFNTTDYAPQYNTAMIAGKTGAHDIWTTAIGPDSLDKYITLDAPPVGPDGKTNWSNVGGTIGSRSSLLITSACKYPEALVGWTNYFYTEQGGRDFLLGPENEVYTVEADGSTKLTELITKNPDGLTQAQAQYLYSLGGGGQNPTLATDQTFKGGETYKTSLDGNPKFKPFIPKSVWEGFPMTAEQASQIASVSADISAVIVEYEAKFVTGALDIDAKWAEYQDKLDQAGRKTYLKAYNDAFTAMP